MLREGVPKSNGTWEKRIGEPPCSSIDRVYVCRFLGVVVDHNNNDSLISLWAITEIEIGT